MNAKLQIRNFGFKVSYKIVSDVKLFTYVTITPGFSTDSITKNIEYGALSMGLGTVIELFQNPDFMHDVPLKNCKS
ncbi:MAG: hypothetical protein EBX95_12425 [Acidimicrobiia bacterium]|nr:hypothetical protein [Acidimicrobiia bacterium]